MSEEKLLTVREVSSLLGITEKEVLELAESGQIPAYKIAGVYLRFKRDQVKEFIKVNKSSLPKSDSESDLSFKERLGDFCYFNDFYIFSALLIALLLFIIFGTY